MVIAADKSLPENFEAMRRAVGELVDNAKEKTGFGYRLVFDERNTRRHGIQSVPARISFDSEEDFFTFIGKTKEAEKIIHWVNQLREKIPVLKPWANQNPRKVLKHLDAWPGLINVLLYFRDNPRPRMFIRELPIKVHTKFIEQHEGILRELLAIIIPEHINQDGNTFEEQFNLKSAVPLIRIRRLDDVVDADIFTLSDDLAIPADVFKRLTPQCRYVVVVENQMTFLTLPPLDNTIAVYGGGFKVENLKKAAWLKSKTIIYWGDIDVHGFLILSLVRKYFPSTISIMMDEETFRRFRVHRGKGTVSKGRDDLKLNLTPEELKLYRLLKEGNYRLEQEHLSQDYIAAQFEKLIPDPSDHRRK